MAKSNRPSLNKIMDKGSERAAQEQAPASQIPTKPQRREGKRAQGWVQLNTYVPEDLRTRAKIKALQQGKDLSDVVSELLKRWTDES